MISENEKIVSVHFDSILDVMEAPPSKSMRNKNFFDNLIKHGHRGEGGGWYGPTNRNSKDVISHALLGDVELCEKYLKPMIAKLEEFTNLRTIDYVQHVKEVKRKKVRKDFGDELDIHQIYQGRADKAWTTTERIEQDSKHHLVTLLIELTDNVRQDVVPTLWKAAVVTFLQREIERAGKSLRVIAASASSGTICNDNRNVTTSIIVKEYNETLNFERLAAMSHLGFYRVFGFAAKNCYDKDLMSSLGRASRISEHLMPIKLEEEIKKGHTKAVFLGAPKSLRDAKASLTSAYEQMKSFQ